MKTTTTTKQTNKQTNKQTKNKTKHKTKQTNKQTNGCLLLLKAFSWETHLCVTQGGFMKKKEKKNAKLGREIRILLKINELKS